MPTPTALQANVHGVINRTMLKTNPGKTNKYGSIDLDWADIGRHWPPNVPAPYDLDSKYYYEERPRYWKLKWSNPTRNPDGSLFDDFQGNIVTFTLFDNGEHYILQQLYFDPIETFVIDELEIPEKTTHWGVSTFNAEGEQSEMILAILQ